MILYLTFHEASAKKTGRNLSCISMPRLWYNVLLLNWFCSLLLMKLHSKKNWSKETLCVRPYSCSEWSRTFECQGLSCLESWLKFPLLFVLKNIRKWSTFVNGSGLFLSVPNVIIISDFFPFWHKNLNSSQVFALHPCIHFPAHPLGKLEFPYIRIFLDQSWYVRVRKIIQVRKVGVRHVRMRLEPYHFLILGWYGHQVKKFADVKSN